MGKQIRRILLFYFQADFTCTHSTVKGTVLMFSFNALQFYRKPVLLSAQMFGMQPKAASCRQDHRARRDLSRDDHSNNHQIHRHVQSTCCCMVLMHVRSVHDRASWCILEAPRQPIQTCSGVRPTSVRSKPVSSTGRVYKPSSEQTRFLHRC